MSRLYFIAEIGQNHQGSLKIAKEMVDALTGTGIKAIKTAKRDIDVCLSEEQKRMPYINDNSFGKTYYEHRKALELSHDDFISLKEYVESKGFDFISSYTDIPSFEFLKSIGMKRIKIASQRIADIKLLKYTAKHYKGIIYMSSGMSTIEDIERMISILRKNEKYLLQCTSSYPCDNKDLNLRVLKQYQKLFKNKVNGFGFSGHNMSIAPDIAAFALGAKIIERHFTLDKKLKGTDHKSSLDLNDLKKLLKYLKQISNSLGDSKKDIIDNELPAMKKLRGDLQ